MNTSRSRKRSRHEHEAHQQKLKKDVAKRLGHGARGRRITGTLSDYHLDHCGP